MKLVDYSWARPGGAAIKAAGYDGVMRYVPYVGDGGKGLREPELADLRGNGLGLGMVFESTAARHRDGIGAGTADGQASFAALRGLGVPDTLPVFFAVDFDAQPADFPAIDAYQRGAQSALGIDRVGIYGSYDVIEHCRQSGAARWLWQCLAWSKGRKHSARHLFQDYPGTVINGGEVDINETNGDDLGWLWLPAQEDTSMTDDELLAVWSGGEDRYPNDDSVPKEKRGQLRPRDERLTNARYRRDQAAAGLAPSVAELAASASAAVAAGIPAAPAQSADVASHDHVGGKVVLT